MSRMTRMSMPLLPLGLALGLAAGLTGQARGGETGHEPESMAVVTPAQIRWGSPPAVFPAGAEAVVLHGDLMRSGEVYTVRMKMPDGYRIAPHTHPMNEHVTVMRGTLMLGTGSRFDETAVRALPAGSFFMVPAGHPHYVWVRGETILQVHGVGPFGMTYVNPKDDPRNGAR